MNNYKFRNITAVPVFTADNINACNSINDLKSLCEKLNGFNTSLSFSFSVLDMGFITGLGNSASRKCTGILKSKCIARNLSDNIYIDYTMYKDGSIFIYDIKSADSVFNFL